VGDDGRAVAGAKPVENATTTKASKAPLDLAKAREFWSFKPPVRAETPATKDKQWAWSTIDSFLLAAMEKSGSLRSPTRTSAPGCGASRST
jgi:hypothetical protein